MEEKLTTRKLDDLGRLVLPVEALEKAGIGRPDALDIFYDAERGGILLKPAVMSCLCCGATEELRLLPNGRRICGACLSQAK